MKIKIKALLQRLILWVAGDYLDAKVDKVIHQLRLGADNAASGLRRQNNEQWQMFNERITALQAIDTSVDGRERGKIIIIATVAGQDIIKIIDIPRGASLGEHARMLGEIKERYGARVEFVDGPPGVRQVLDYDGRATRRAAARDRGFM